MTTHAPDHATAEAALSNQGSYREHVHRSIMIHDIPEVRRGRLDLAFWPTCRTLGFTQPLIANFNCQRCGKAVAPTAGWWCGPCRVTAARLQLDKGWSMVRIAMSGEYDPSWDEWIQDHAPWLVPERLCARFDGPGTHRKQTNDDHNQDVETLRDQDRRRYTAA